MTAELPRGRYRTNADSLLLADFAPRASGVVFDLGAGVGAVGLRVAHRSPAAQVVLVERDPEAAALARRNAAGLARVRVVEADVRDLRERGAAALVVCNPPYVPPGRGRAPSEGRRDARMGDAAPFLDAARALLGRRGCACFSYPVVGLIDFFEALRARGLEPKRLRFVHARAARPARVALVLAKPGKRGGLVVEPPLFEHHAATRA